MTGRVRGFSLIEAMLALVLASGAMIAALNVVGAAAKAEAWAQKQAIGNALANELLAEVSAMLFEQPGSVGSFGPAGPEVGVTARSALNDVDDFNGWVESPPRDRDGQARTDLSGWTRRVLVERVSLAGFNGGAVAYDSRVKRVTVTVEYDGVEVASMRAIRTSAWDDARRGTYTSAAPVGGVVGGLGGLLGGGG